MLQDMRHGIRMLIQNKGWTIVVVLLLSLGIGANTAIFSGVNAVLLKELSVKDPGTLVRLRAAGKNEMGNDFSEYGNSKDTRNGEKVRTTFPYAIFQEFQKANQTMTDLFAAAPIGQLNIVVDDR